MGQGYKIFTIIKIMLDKLIIYAIIASLNSNKWRLIMEIDLKKESLLIIFPSLKPENGRFLLLSSDKKSLNKIHDAITDEAIDITEEINSFDDKFSMQFLNRQGYDEVMKNSTSNLRYVYVENAEGVGIC